MSEMASKSLIRRYIYLEPELSKKVHDKCKKKGYKFSPLTRALYHLWMSGGIGPRKVRIFYEAVQDQTGLLRSANMKKIRQAGRVKLAA